MTPQEIVQQALQGLEDWKKNNSNSSNCDLRWFRRSLSHLENALATSMLIDSKKPSERTYVAQAGDCECVHGAIFSGCLIHGTMGA